MDITTIHIPGRINSSISNRPNPDLEKIQNTIADYLVGQGLNEIWNNSLSKTEYTEINNDFNSKENVELLNPLSKGFECNATNSTVWRS